MHALEMLEDVKVIAQKAGHAILEIYQHKDYEQFSKDDNSPVTTADYASNDVLMTELEELYPDIPIISEETAHVSLNARKNWQRYWLLDPMDGTQEFISRSGDFAVCIALVENGWPVMGIIYWPIKDSFYYAVAGHGAYKQTDKGITRLAVAHRQPDEPIRFAVSRVQKLTTLTQYLKSERPTEFIKLGSCSLKSCFVAEGKADCYLRVGPTGEWDTGAPHVIVEEAGGRILDSEFNGLSYNQRETFDNPDFMVLGEQSIGWRDIIKPHRTERDI
ncbi:3'(2'),5'-bisphosphate nucleotidase CysQ [Flocculibacter collagenilyticus]|uniref:3'(2'),5'-bisphosphate nucleotidase CysQ n=1 Tax=Flocculibacter collagenilyticus TaxID=2744479 RepID=UPI0018F2CE7B|nr:3'(2'),5'-bisphosphate nucleotidase CysQ [Flocculibacter collagenilyticus]